MNKIPMDGGVGEVSYREGKKEKGGKGRTRQK